MELQILERQDGEFLSQWKRYYIRLCLHVLLVLPSPIVKLNIIIINIIIIFMHLLFYILATHNNCKSIIYHFKGYLKCIYLFNGLIYLFYFFILNTTRLICQNTFKSMLLLLLTAEYRVVSFF